MTPERFASLFEETVEKCHKLAVLKGGEYSPGKDRLSNFKTNGEALGLPPEAIWAVYAGKHFDSLRTYVQDLVKGTGRTRSEPIEGRFHDLIVYAILGLALVEDRESANPIDMESVKKAIEVRAGALREISKGY